jgi:hypothetical protein
MARKCCPACSGIGSYFGSEWVRDDAATTLFQRITVRKTCEICGGSGRLPEDGVLHTQRCVTRAERPPVRPARSAPEPEVLDRLLVFLLSAVLFGYGVFRLSKEPFVLQGWGKWAVALAAALLLTRLLGKSAGRGRLLRRVALLGVLLLVTGGLAFEFVHG